jgi:hypothetical protein
MMDSDAVSVHRPLLPGRTCWVTIRHPDRGLQMHISHCGQKVLRGRLTCHWHRNWEEAARRLWNLNKKTGMASPGSSSGS